MYATASHESTVGGRRQAILGVFSTHQAQINFAFAATPKTVPSYAVSASFFFFLRHAEVTNIVIPNIKLRAMVDSKLLCWWWALK